MSEFRKDQTVEFQFEGEWRRGLYVQAGSAATHRVRAWFTDGRSRMLREVTVTRVREPVRTERDAAPPGHRVTVGPFLPFDGGPEAFSRAVAAARDEADREIQRRIATALELIALSVSSAPSQSDPTIANLVSQLRQSIDARTKRETFGIAEEPTGEGAT